jgi:SAM-dependent methyltransferase
MISPFPSDSGAPDSSFEFDALVYAVNYRRALVREFRSCLHGTVVEVGAGIGQFTQELQQIPEISKLVAVEPDLRFNDLFRRLNPDCHLISGTVADLPISFTPDTIVSVNVLEHTPDDLAELRRIHSRLLPRQGSLCLFVPACPELYSPLDQDFGHYRRYTRPGLRACLTTAGFRVERLDYFNWIGYFAWWFSFRLLRQRSFNPFAVRAFDRLIFPLVHAMESRFLRPPIGQSLIAVARAAPQDDHC